MNMPRIVLLAVGLFAVSVAACGSSSNDGSGSTGPSGAGAAGSTNTQGAMCAAACVTAGTCSPSFDLGACETRCAQELAGQGILDKTFAASYFPMFAEAKTCEEAMSGGKGPPFGKLFDDRVKICGVVQTNCEAALSTLCNVEFKEKPDEAALICLRTVCASGGAIRAGYQACVSDAKSCVDFTVCRGTYDAMMAKGPWWGQGQ